jgi:hypothetical protein
MPDNKNSINPDHYKIGGIETWDILKAKLSKEELLGFCKGNVIKYISRESSKNGLEDCQKALWYNKKIIELKS